MFRMIDKRIRKAFSDAAIQYDVLASLQSEIGRELVKKVINVDNVDVVFDIGMGTGKVTRRLAFYFPDSLVVGMDIAEGMLQQAQKKQSGHQIIQGDAHDLPLLDGRVDLITSNLSFQWFGDLRRAFGDCARILTDHGQMMITLFGQQTFKELFQSLHATKRENQSFALNYLPARENVQKVLAESGFSDVAIDYELIHVHFPDMMALLRWIKDIGANCLNTDFFVGKEHLARAEKYYEEHFRERLGILSTFEVVWVTARKQKISI